MSTKACFRGKAFLGKPGACAMGQTPWHWSKHVNFRPSELFQKGCLSLHSCQTAILPHVGTFELSILGLPHLSISIHLSNSFILLFYEILSWAGLGRILRCLRKHRKTLMSTKACFRGKAFLGKPGACAMGTNTMALIQTCQIQVMTVPERLSFSAHLTKCNVGPCWHIELSILGLLHLSISIHLSNTFNGSMKFFLGLAWASLGCCLRNDRKTLMSTKACFCGKAFPRQTCNNHLRQKQGCKLIDQI